MVYPNDIDLNLYKFYKTPDGEDCLEKTYYYTKYSAIAGTLFSVYEVVLVSKPPTLRSCIARIGRFTLPLAAMGFAFGSTICILGQLRKKSDWTNHLLGGMAAGAVWGAKFNSVSKGHQSAVILGFLCAYYKYFDYHNIPIFTMRTYEQRHNYPNMDFTIKLYDDPGRPDEV